VGNPRVEDPGVERSRVDADRLLLAILAVKAQQQMTVAGVSRATGVARSTLSTFMAGGKLPTGHDIVAILGWLHLDAALIMLPPQPKQAAPEPEPAAAEAAPELAGAAA
jgi:transcriptional regulator with XRE-family HTH domain